MAGAIRSRPVSRFLSLRLERVFRSSYGRSIHQELLEARVQAAAHSLRMGKPIKVVANEVGFADYYYFVKVFKRVQGVTAGAFQAAHQPTVVARNGGQVEPRGERFQREKRPW
jgi:AraC-like DNA-binding protein